ncbi:PorP/SprF family type IX secretion system membrane protein [Daejeonella oryzae]|uniref:PorP/SprF family type IX secretion system membrane protein n=1 Tax=Daejeonella oryzae TaxID=1122943 RepID=UPI000429169B|nr:type IX secretion system membrane protein PorP/SprF [Daejeonella oryzae]
MKRILLTLLLFCIIQLAAKAQQDAHYSQYMFNSLVINPAYAGYKEAYNLSLLNRNQWVGIEGAPKTQSFIADGAFFKGQKVGLGLAVVNDKIGLQGTTSAYANYAYRLPVGKDNARLAFGLALGVTQYTLNGNSAVIEDPNDPNYNDGRLNYTAPDAKFGLFFSNDKFYAGASATNLLSESQDYQETGQSVIARQGRHYFLTAGYLLDLNPTLKFKPSFMIRDDAKGPTNIDLNTFFLIKEAVWVGASYRTGAYFKNNPDVEANSFKQNSLVGAVELFVAKKFRLGYAYDYALSDLSSYSNGTHEISLGLILQSSKTTNALPTPRYF